MKIIFFIILWLLAMISIAFAVEIGIEAAWKFITKKEKKND